MTSIQGYEKGVDDIQAEVLRQEDVESKSIGDAQTSWPVSAYASLSPLAVSRTFWKAWMFAAMAAFGM
jgi:hypothetical protein